MYEALRGKRRSSAWTLLGTKRLKGLVWPLSEREQGWDGLSIWGKFLILPEIFANLGNGNSFLKEEGVVMIITASISLGDYHEGHVGHTACHIAFAEKIPVFLPLMQLQSLQSHRGLAWSLM